MGAADFGAGAGISGFFENQLNARLGLSNLQINQQDQALREKEFAQRSKMADQEMDMRAKAFAWEREKYAYDLAISAIDAWPKVSSQEQWTPIASMVNRVAGPFGIKLNEKWFPAPPVITEKTLGDLAILGAVNLSQYAAAAAMAGAPMTPGARAFVEYGMTGQVTPYDPNNPYSPVFGSQQHAAALDAAKNPFNAGGFGRGIGQPMPATPVGGAGPAQQQPMPSMQQGMATQQAGKPKQVGGQQYAQMYAQPQPQQPAQPQQQGPPPTMQQQMADQQAGVPKQVGGQQYAQMMQTLPMQAGSQPQMQNLPQGSGPQQEMRNLPQQMPPQVPQPQLPSPQSAPCPPGVPQSQCGGVPTEMMGQADGSLGTFPGGLPRAIDTTNTPLQKPSDMVNPYSQAQIAEAGNMPIDTRQQPAPARNQAQAPQQTKKRFSNIFAPVRGEKAPEPNKEHTDRIQQITKNELPWIASHSRSMEEYLQISYPQRYEVWQRAKAMGYFPDLEEMPQDFLAANPMTQKEEETLQGQAQDRGIRATHYGNQDRIGGYNAETGRINAGTNTFRANTSATQGKERLRQGEARIGIAGTQAETGRINAETNAFRAGTSARQGDARLKQGQQRIDIAKGETGAGKQPKPGRETAMYYGRKLGKAPASGVLQLWAGTQKVVRNPKANRAKEGAEFRKAAQRLGYSATAAARLWNIFVEQAEAEMLKVR